MIDEGHVMEKGAEADRMDICAETLIAVVVSWTRRISALFVNILFCRLFASMFQWFYSKRHGLIAVCAEPQPERALGDESAYIV